MKPADDSLIVEFLKAGGRVSRVKESVRVSEGELLDYLASCGITIKYSAGPSGAYRYEGKRVHLSTLLGLANQHRRTDQLSPFALRIDLAPFRRRA